MFARFQGIDVEVVQTGAETMYKSSSIAIDKDLLEYIFHSFKTQYIE